MFRSISIVVVCALMVFVCGEAAAAPPTGIVKVAGDVESETHGGAGNDSMQIIGGVGILVGGSHGLNDLNQIEQMGSNSPVKPNADGVGFSAFAARRAANGTGPLPAKPSNHILMGPLVVTGHRPAKNQSQLMKAPTSFKVGQSFHLQQKPLTSLPAFKPPTVRPPAAAMRFAR